MAANATGVDWLSVQNHLIYAVEGGAMLVSNALIVLTIGRYAALRDIKEFFIIAAMAFADGLSGLATLHTALYRLPVLLSGRPYALTSRRFCFFACGLAVFGNLSYPAQGLMMAAVAFDRILIISVPLKRMSWKISYAWGLVGLVYGICGLFWLVMFVRVWPLDENDVMDNCWNSRAHAPDDLLYVYYIYVGPTILSVGMYLAVIVVYSKRIQGPAGGQIQQHTIDFQRRLTKTMGISSLATFFLVVVPEIADHYIFAVPGLMPPDVKSALSMWFLISANLNPILNIFIYRAKQLELKVGMKSMLKNKEMPPSLNAWNLS